MNPQGTVLYQPQRPPGSSWRTQSSPSSSHDRSRAPSGNERPSNETLHSAQRQPAQYVPSPGDQMEEDAPSPAQYAPSPMDFPHAPNQSTQYALSQGVALPVQSDRFRPQSEPAFTQYNFPDAGPHRTAASSPFLQHGPHTQNLPQNRYGTPFSSSSSRSAHHDAQTVDVRQQGVQMEAPVRHAEYQSTVVNPSQYNQGGLAPNGGDSRHQSTMPTHHNYQQPNGGMQNAYANRYGGPGHSAHQQQGGGMHNAYADGTQGSSTDSHMRPGAGPSTTEHHQQGGGMRNAYGHGGSSTNSQPMDVYNAQYDPGPSTMLTQQTHNRMSQPDEERMEIEDDHRPAHSPPSHDQAHNQTQPQQPFRPPYASQHNPGPSTASSRPLPQPRGVVPQGSVPIPGSSSSQPLPGVAELLASHPSQPTPRPSGRQLPHVDFAQHKRRHIAGASPPPTGDHLQHLEDRARRAKRELGRANAQIAQVKDAARAQFVNDVTEHPQVRPKGGKPETTGVQEQLMQTRDQLRQVEADKKAAQQKLDKQQAAYEANIASLTRPGASGRPLPAHPVFPDGPPMLKPHFISESTRTKRQLDTINRNVGGNLPLLRKVHRDNGSDSDDSGSESGREGEGEGEGVGGSGKGKGKEREEGSRLREVLSSDKQLLAGIVREIMKEMDVGRVKKSKRKQVCRATKLDQAKKEQQRAMTKEDDLNCKSVLREIFRNATGLDRAVDFCDYEPATEEQALHCGEQTGERPQPGRSPFFFGKGWKSSMWNDMLVRGLVADLRRRQEADQRRLGIPQVSTEYLMARFLDSVKEGRLNWARHKPRPGETQEQARVRALAFDRRTNTGKLGRSRKETKWGKRFSTTKKMTLLCAGNPEALKCWRWAKKLVVHLGIHGMSSEEGKDHKFQVGRKLVRQTVHFVRVCAWRPAEVADVMDLIDKAGEQITTRKGHPARPRIRTTQISNTPAPVGLPRALYDAQWMEEGLEMDSDFEEDLEVSEEGFRMMQVVAENLGIQIDEEDDEMED
ncbi:hypothetical protein DFH06DRAFT_1127483 [Mycena polygramma]|nr:hypothetical protein DFH06DRAFT_1127483 [Mycena polygramma]